MEEDPKRSFPSLPKRLVLVFFSPGELFVALRERPAWFWALLVVGVVTVLSVALLPADLMMEFTRSQLLEQGREVPPGLESSQTIIRVFSIAGGAIGVFLMTFVMAGIVTFFFAFLLGDEGRYVQYLSVVAHASFISALGTLLLVPLKISVGDPSLTLNLGTFLYFLDQGYPASVLRFLDLFALWAYAVMAIGVTKMDPRRSLGFSLTFFMVFALAFAMVVGIWAT